MVLSHEDLRVLGVNLKITYPLIRKLLNSCALLLVLTLSVKGQAPSGTISRAFLTQNCSPLQAVQVNYTANVPGSVPGPVIFAWSTSSPNAQVANPTFGNTNINFNAPGPYTITCVLTNSFGSTTLTDTIFINPSPTANFVASDTLGCFPMTVTFKDLSNAGGFGATITNWTWDPGTGVFYTQPPLTAPPTITYNNATNATVTLIVKNSYGCSATLPRPMYIKVNQGVVPDFTPSVSSSCKPPTAVTFTNTTTGPPVLSYTWNYGDGTTGAGATGNHIYTVPGNYTVVMTASSTAGCVDSYSTNISIGSNNNQSNFVAPDSACVGAPVTFTNTSNPLPGNSLWKYGDGKSSTAYNGQDTFYTTGTYNVTLINSYGTCTDSFSKPIQVLNPPKAAFTAVGNTNSCSAPFTVQFQNQSTNSNSWTWNFGDNTTNSNAQNPVHTYTTYGQFTVTLIASNASGCGDQVIKTFYVNVLKPAIRITNLPTYGCAPVVFTPTYADTVADGIANLSWNYGDGFTFTGLTPPSHTYMAGKYLMQVTLTTTGGCTATYMDSIKVGTIKPTPQFLASPDTVCRSTPVSFYDQSGGNPNQWLWEFGDGGTSTVENPTYQYTRSGTFTVTLIAYNNGCQDSIVKKNYVVVNPPFAKFGYSFGCGKNQVIFSDSSTGADTWKWDFGDGSGYSAPPGQANPPPHSYATMGNYTVRLIVHNNTYNCTDTSYQTVVFNAAPTLIIESPAPICKNQVVQFGTLNYSMVKTFTFDFGDGSPTYTGGGSAQHTYKVPGNYTTSLVMQLLNGCSVTDAKNFSVNGPTAGFTVDSTVSCSPFNAIFKDTSKTDGRNAIAKWEWNFGDGSPISNTPSHYYASAGVYSTSLKVTDASGCADSAFKPNYVVVSIIHANFTGPDSSCPKAILQFRDSSFGGFNPTSFWDFGNGDTSTALNPSISYTTSGLFPVKHRVTDQYGCSATFTDTVVINSPVASFRMSDSITSCPPLQVLFTFTGSYYHSLIWNFDGSTIVQDSLAPRHIYTIPNLYTPTLTVVSPGGCIAKAQDTITVNGPHLNSYNYTPIQGCDSMTVFFSVGTNDKILRYTWNFGDGSKLDSTVTDTVSHFYRAPANFRDVYIPSVTLTNDSNCSVTYTIPDTIVVVDIKANFGISRTVGCVDNLLLFSDSTLTNGQIAKYIWDFGDGQVDSGLVTQPSHVYTSQANYTVTLKIRTQNNCVASVSKSLKVVNSPSIDIDSALSQCVPASINFKGVIIVPDTSALTWSWNFFNGNTATGQFPPTQLYPKAGQYSVQAVAVNSSGCTDTANHTFDIYPLPAVFAGKDTTICLGDSLLLMASGASTYTWLPPASSSLSCPVCANTIATPRISTTYIVNGISTFGCQAKDTIHVTVNQPVKVSVNPADSVCLGQSAQLMASGAALYAWSPAGSLSNPTVANPLATPPASTTYQVIGSDNHYCFYDTQYVNVTVFNYPSVNVGSDATILVGSSYQINGAGSPDIISINWTPVTGLSCTNCLNPLASPQNTTDYIVDVVNSGGCKASDSIKITVICNDNNIFVPNTFSPNGDGVNDIFYVRGKGLNTIPSMTIYNRWGQIVFQKKDFAPNDPSAGWDGMINGKKAPMDVYIYTIEIICDNSTLVPYHGNVALIR
jgi:gliding motility-associated-like protein